MGGCKLIVISGIDGSFAEFENTVEPYLKDANCIKISYDRSLTFKQNLDIIMRLINNIETPLGIIGWSIGAVAATFLSPRVNHRLIVIINAFFIRSEILKKRNIICDEEVSIINTNRNVHAKYVILAGQQDKKIPYTESLKIIDFYHLDSESLKLFDNASHNLSSFPPKSIAIEINKHIPWIA